MKTLLLPPPHRPLLGYTNPNERRTFIERGDFMDWWDEPKRTGLIELTTSDENSPFSEQLLVFRIGFPSMSDLREGDFHRKEFEIYFEPTRLAWESAYRMARILSEVNPSRKAQLKWIDTVRVVLINVPFEFRNCWEVV